MTGPDLPPVRNRVDAFAMAVTTTVEYLRGAPEYELQGVTFEIAPTPDGVIDDLEVERWRVLPEQRRIILYRIPIQRLGRLHRNDELHQRMLVEKCVLQAVGEFIGRDPWDLLPPNFRPE